MADSNTASAAPIALNTREAARFIGFSESFLRHARSDGDRPGRTPAPPYVRIGQGRGAKIRYLRADLEAWLHAHRVEDRRLAQ